MQSLHSAPFMVFLIRPRLDSNVGPEQVEYGGQDNK
jgi:hypothetical protein